MCCMINCQYLLQLIVAPLVHTNVNMPPHHTGSPLFSALGFSLGCRTVGGMKLRGQNIVSLAKY